MYHISNVREVFTEGKNSISIRLLDEGKIVRLASINIEALAKELQIVLSRWYNQQPSRYLSERKLEPKDVPGTFLNLAFLNLCSSEPWLRVAAYKLLCAVKDAFKLQIDYKLDASHDICIPQNCSQFVLDVSQQLAVKEPHLTLEFLSEVVAGFQRYSTACKQNCLAYLSPWMPNMSNYITRNETSRAEQEKLSKIFDLLVSLTISEVEMYPLIQDYVWAKISKEVDLLRNVLDSFIKACIVDGLSSLKVKVLSDTAVTLARYHSNMVSSIIINRMRKVLLHTREKPVETLERHFLWVELVVLSQFLVNLSFCNYINILSHLPDLFYLCVMMIGHGPTYAKAGIHSIIINSLNSLLSLPKILDNESVTKVITLKLVEFSQPQFYRQFGLQNMKSAVEALYTYNSQMPSVAQFEITKDPLSSTSVVSIVEHLQEVMNCVREVYTDMEWHLRWQKLARRSAFFYNPSLQTRSFLMLGVISSHASSHVITRTLKVMEEVRQTD
jgi:neurofibromin 1